MSRFVRRVTSRPGAALSALLAAVVLAGPISLAAPASAATRDCRSTTLDQDIKHADVVFRGVVTKVRSVQGSGDQRTRNYRVKADRVYRGSLVTDKVTVTAAVGTACDVPTLDQNGRYIFFVTEKGSQLLASPATARASHDLTRRVQAKLGDGVQPHSTPPATAEFTKVADASPPSLSRLVAPGVALVIVSLLGLFVVGRVGRRTT